MAEAGGPDRGFGEILHALRNAADLKQTDIGKRLRVRKHVDDVCTHEVSDKTVSGWERGSPLGDFKGETRAGTLALFEKLEADLVDLARNRASPLPDWYREGDLRRAVASIIDARELGVRRAPVGRAPVEPGGRAPAEPAGGSGLPADRRLWAVLVVVAVLATGSVAWLVMAAGDEPEPEGPAPARAGAVDTPVSYSDDFSDPRSGWNDLVDAKGSVRYDGGRYKVVILQPNRGTFAYRDWSDLPPAVRLEVDTTKVSAGLGSFGLACRDTGGVRYEARIDLNRTWKITRGVDRATPARQLEAGSSDVIRGDGVNRVAMECRGQAVPGPVVVALYVNEQLVAETTDADGLAPGRVGVVVASGADAVEVLFDDFVIRPI